MNVAHLLPVQRAAIPSSSSASRSGGSSAASTAALTTRRRRAARSKTVTFAHSDSNVDLDRPDVLAERGLRPSLVATRHREVTQPQALAIHETGADGVRWWSTFESLWANVTLFDRAVRRLRVVRVAALAADDAALREALELLGIATG